jgi:hypothetical protein
MPGFWFIEGFDPEDLQEARTLIEACIFESLDH